MESTPPVALTEWRYAAVAAAATAVVAVWGDFLETRLSQPITILDAFGLGLFATTGTWRALDGSLPVTTALFIGVVTAVGGGVIRDILVTRVPVVLRREVYAMAAVAGSGLAVLADAMELDRAGAGVAAVGLTASLRLVAAHKRWNVPKLPSGASNRREALHR